jgi:hypothetical protein
MPPLHSYEVMGKDEQNAFVVQARQMAVPASSETGD